MSNSPAPDTEFRATIHARNGKLWRKLESAEGRSLHAIVRKAVNLCRKHLPREQAVEGSISFGAKTGVASVTVALRDAAFSTRPVLTVQARLNEYVEFGGAHRFLTLPEFANLLRGEL